MKPRPMSLLYVGVMFLFMLLSPQIGLSEDEPDLGYQNFFIAGSPDPKNTLIETNKDYYSVYLFSVFLDKDESFFKKNNLAVLVNLEVDPKSRYRIT